MQGPVFVECHGSLPDVNSIAIVASTKGIRFVPVEVKKTLEGDSWLSLVLAREDDPSQTIEIQTVSRDPLVVKVCFQTDAKCGPVAFHIAMETHGRTLNEFS